MNKIAKLMCLVAVIALIGTSCKKNEETVTCQGAFVEMNSTEEGAKTYKVGNRIEWDADDMVEIFNVANGNNSFTHGTFSVSGAGNYATFTLMNGNITTQNQGAFYAFYPSGNQYVAKGGGFKEAWTTGNGHVKGLFLLPPVQQYRVINGIPAIPQGALAAAAKEENTSYLGDVRFNFQAINGVLVLRYYLDDPSWVNTKKVDYITVTDKRVHIAGLMEVYLDKVNPTELMQKLNAFNPDDDVYMANLLTYKQQIGYYIPEPSANPYLSKTVKLQCKTDLDGQFPNGVTLGTSANTATIFNIALRPGAFSHGMVIQVHYTDGSYYVPYNDNGSPKLMIRPNTNTNMQPRRVAYQFAE